MLGRWKGREDLRKAWEANRQPNPAASKTYEAAPPVRHLSQRERAEMREQLRRQQEANKRPPAPDARR